MNEPDSARRRDFSSIVQRAYRRYRRSGFIAWQFARVKLRTDPVYRTVLYGPWLRGGCLLDLGCGGGLMLATLLAARELSPPPQVAERTDALAPKLPDRLIGIETRPHVAAIAQDVLGHGVEIVSADARATVFPASRTILIFDVLHMMPGPDQETLLDRMLLSLEPGGVLLLREANAAAGWKFRVVQFSNLSKAILSGGSPSHFCFRTAVEWRALLERRGLEVSSQATDRGNPFGNVLFAATKPRAVNA